MLRLLNNWLRQNGFGKTLIRRRPRARWEEHPPILQQVRAWDGAEPLTFPDAGPMSDRGVQMAPGAWDGVLTHHVGAPANSAGSSFVGSALFNLERLVHTGGDEARTGLYELARSDVIVPYADAIVTRLASRKGIGPFDLLPHARWLVSSGCHREPVKLGMVLLGACGTAADVKDLMLLGRHDEFTLFAVVGAGNLVEDPVDLWWELARGVSGWGRIHAVERLADRVKDRPDIQAWLLREGCRNDIMPEYVACLCARAGDLAEALAVSHPDDALLAGACVIVEALLSGGPAETVEDYRDAPAAMERLVSHLVGRCDSLARLHGLLCISRWLEHPDPPPTDPAARASDGPPPGMGDAWSRRTGLGWSRRLRTELGWKCRHVLSGPRAAAMARQGFDAADDLSQQRAWNLAEVLGIDLWEEGFERLCRDPLHPRFYGNLMRTDDLRRAHRILDFAERHLPLTRIATGPADLLGLGPAFAAHACLERVVERMRGPDLFNARLVAAALRSPVVANRSTAVAVLERLPPEHWGSPIRDVLLRSAQDEPHTEVRDRIAELLDRG